MTMLEKEDELVRIKKEVKAEYEIAAVTAKLDRKQAVLFENVNGGKNRVACNVLGTARRFYLALRGIPKKSEEYSIKRDVHSSVNEALNTLSEPVRKEGGALFEENSSRNLYDLPIVTHFEKDAGPFITSSIVFSQNQENGSRTNPLIGSSG
jgi:2,5-furandicarboxylate decarboxylase 1